MIVAGFTSRSRTNRDTPGVARRWQVLLATFLALALYEPATPEERTYVEAFAIEVHEFAKLNRLQPPDSHERPEES